MAVSILINFIEFGKYLHRWGTPKVNGFSILSGPRAWCQVIVTKYENAQAS